MGQVKAVRYTVAERSNQRGTYKMKSPLETYLREALGQFRKIAQQEEYIEKLGRAALGAALKRLDEVGNNLSSRKKSRAFKEAIRPDLAHFTMYGAEQFVEFLLRSQARER
jgi:hypothetical protein